MTKLLKFVWIVVGGGCCFVYDGRYLQLACECPSVSMADNKKDASYLSAEEEWIQRKNNMYEKGSGSGKYGAYQVEPFPKFKFNPVVSIGAALLLWTFVIWTAVDSDPDDPNNARMKLSEGKTWVTATWTWLYVFSQDYWVMFLVPLVYYYGDVKLGKPDEKAEYSDVAYFAMVFCAGVAIGLIFYGASEPLWHYTDGTNRYNANGYYNENEMMQAAMNVTIYHWGLQAWVVYALVAVTMGFLCYRKELPLTFRVTMAPLFGKAIWGWMGDLLDIYTIATVVAGLCTSLGYGAAQIVTGMKRLGWIDTEMNDDQTANAACWVVGVITMMATISVVCGLDWGIKTCSLTAFALGNFLLFTTFFLDQPWYILNVIVQSFGYHFQNLIQIGFYTDAFAQLKVGEGHATDGKGANPSWMDWWTVFYWGWWISWAPFVGTFLARISRGRTIQNVLAYSLIVPLLYCFMWFGTFGASALRMHQQASLIQKAGKDLYNNENHWEATNLGWRGAKAGKCFTVPEGLDCKEPTTRRLLPNPNCTKILKGYEATNRKLTPVCLFSSADTDGYWFDLVGHYHGIGKFMSAVSVITIMLYFVTSSDSGSLVVDLIAANGEEAHVVQRVFWAVSEGAVAIVLMQTGRDNALKALQFLSIIAGLPITIILMLMTLSLWRALSAEAENANLTTWTMPLYGGLFEWVDHLGKKCGGQQAEPPKTRQVQNFLLGLFLPPLPVYNTLRGIRPTKSTDGMTDEQLKAHQKVEQKGHIEDVMMTVGCGLAFFFFILMHALTPVESGLYGIGWTAYVAFVVVVSYVRYMTRLSHKVVGSGMEDFLVTLLFFPQVIAQFADQAEPREDEKKETTKV